MRISTLIKTTISLSCVLLLCSCGKGNKENSVKDNESSAISTEPKVQINLKDYITVTFDGYDTAGRTKSYGLETERLIKENPTAFGISESDDSAISRVLKDVSNYFNITLDKYDLLSNGETVTFIWDEKYKELSDKYNVEIDSNGTEITVEGLEELQEIDPFEVVQVEFKADPSGLDDQVRWCTITQGYNAYDARCQLDREMANVGETVTVSFVSPITDYSIEEYFATQGYKPTRTEKDFTVE